MVKRKRRPNGYWKEFSNVENELNPIIEQLGHFPTQKELTERNKGGIIGVFKHHGGIIKVRELLGYKFFRKQENYWKDFNNLEKELIPIIKQLGHFPSARKLLFLGHSDLVLAIRRHYNGFRKTRIKFGYEPVKKIEGYWKEFSNVENELNPIIEQLGHFPTENELKEIGKGQLSKPIWKYHGGVGVVREKMGYGIQRITSKNQFLNFLKGDETAKDLVVGSIVLNGNRRDIEKIIVDMYADKFKDESLLSKLIEESKKEIEEMIAYGITNLGSYVGKYSVKEKSIVPILAGQMLGRIPKERINPSLEDKFVKMLRGIYGPLFNEDSERALKGIQDQIDCNQDKAKILYEKLKEYYGDVLKISWRLNDA